MSERASAKTFYGYKHWSLEEPSRCFNVGKGLEGRSRSLHKRNHKWHAIVKRLGLRVEECISFMCNEHKHLSGERCPADVAACTWEIENITLMKTFSTNHSHDDDNDIGCNFTHGGEGTAGCHLSIETRARMSASFKGKAKSDTHKAKLSAAVKATFDAHPLSDETKMKMSLSHRGKRMSDVTRSKISLASKGRSPGNKGCKRVVINGEIKYEQKQES